MDFRILALGDVVGRPGRRLIQDRLPALRVEQKIDFCVINGENVAAGSGIQPDHYKQLTKAGADVITSGDHIFKRKEIFSIIDDAERLIRPANYPNEARGRGHVIVETVKGIDVGVVNLQGRVFMEGWGCPFHKGEHVIEQIKSRTPVIIVDMHAEATSEKIGMGWHLDGKASLVYGTHTHVQTADERVLPKGTAFISDVGMCGPHDGIIGRRADRVLHKMITSLPASFSVTNGDVQLNGVVTTVNGLTGRALSIQRVRVLEDQSVEWGPLRTASATGSTREAP